jgi:hypothetical protein
MRNDRIDFRFKPKGVLCAGNLDGEQQHCRGKKDELLVAHLEKYTTFRFQ